MGRSAKLMKRPTKAEKLARSVNEPSTSRQVQRPRSLSPEIEGARPLPIPLFNTSAKRFGKRLAADSAPMSLDSSAAPSPRGGSDKEMISANTSDGEMETDGNAEGRKTFGGKKKSLKDKLKAAKELVREGEERSREKLQMGKNKGKKPAHILGGVDYLKLHESRPGGFKKKLR